MSLIQAQKQRDLKYQASTLLNSSRDLGWSTMFAELRSHGPYEQPGTAGPHLEIALAVRGSDEGLVATKFAGSWRRVRPTTGTIWLRPFATKADECRMAPSAWEAIHLYMSSVVFERLKDDYNLPAGPESSIRYSCGVQDEVINQVESDRRGPHARGNVVAAARGAAGVCARRNGAHSAADTDTTSAG